MSIAKLSRVGRLENAFRRFAVQCAGAAAALLLFAGVSAQDAAAQAAPLGDHYVFFVEGVNVALPAAQGMVVDDPKDASNKAIRFDNANWGYHAFRFHDHAGTPPAGAPVDMSANRSAGNVLSFRILADPANEPHCEAEDTFDFAILFEDFGAPPTDPMDLSTADLPFRLRWTVPKSMCDGEWHDVSVKLPPPTWKELEDGKMDGSISGLEANWVYGGAWSEETEGVALDLMGPNTAEKPELWKEFEWNNVRSVGPFWDWADAGAAGGPVYLDDVFIGPADLDLSELAGRPAAMSGVTVAADGSANVVSWTHNSDFGGYNVYFSGSPITDVTADNVSLLQKVSAAPWEYRHQVEVPYGFSSSGSTLYYAVTSLSASGVENPDVSNSAVEIDNPDLVVSPGIFSLTDEQDEAFFNALTAGMASNEPFPDRSMPFVVDDMHSQPADAPLPPDDNDDLSASVWVAFYPGNEDLKLEPSIWIYAEVTDDVADYSPSADGPEGAWQYDSIELGWGNYDVRDAGGSVLGGSPHSGMMRGEFPDYQLRISPHGSKSDATAKTNVAADGGPGDKPGQSAVYEPTENGYKVLAQFTAAHVNYPGDADADFPGMDEVRFMPFTVTLNDADGGGGDPPREHQITWSLNPTVTNQWWNTPSQWQVVGMVGPMSPVSAEGGTELPEAFALEQNYPNPFNPATTIRFQLPQAEQVTLRVFDVLGREVAALLEDASMSAGGHTVRFDASGLVSGLYLYRLEAGASFAQTRRMMLVK